MDNEKSLKQSWDKFSSESKQPECACVCVLSYIAGENKIIDCILFFVLVDHLQTFVCRHSIPQFT